MKACKQCNGYVDWDQDKQLLTNPPQYKGECTKCGMVQYAYVDEVATEYNVDDMFDHWEGNYGY